MPRPTSSHGKAGETTTKQKKKNKVLHWGKSGAFSMATTQGCARKLCLYKIFKYNARKKIADRCLNRILQWRTAK